MGLVAAKCTSCGSAIQVDDSKEAGICKHCGTAFITEKVINNYNITQNITQNITKNIYGADGKEADELLREGEKLFELDQKEKALGKFRKAIDVAPTNWYAWFCCAVALSHQLSEEWSDDDKEEEVFKTFDTARKCLEADNSLPPLEKEKQVKLVYSAMLRSEVTEAIEAYIIKYPNDYAGYLQCVKSGKSGGGYRLVLFLEKAYQCAALANDEKGKAEVMESIKSFSMLGINDAKKFAKTVDKLLAKGKRDAVLKLNQKDFEKHIAKYY